MVYAMPLCVMILTCTTCGIPCSTKSYRWSAWSEGTIFRVASDVGI